MNITFDSCFRIDMINSWSPSDNATKQTQQHLCNTYKTVTSLIKSVDYSELIAEVILGINEAICQFDRLNIVSTLNLYGLFPHVSNQYISILAFGKEAPLRTISPKDFINPINVEIIMNDFMKIKLSMVPFGKMLRIVNINIVKYL
jgi:hypothetical protein